MTLTGIYLYPVKSMAGVSVDTVALDRFGPVGDRRWMVIDERGRFLTQRELPDMALIRPSAREKTLLLQCGESSIVVEQPEADHGERRVQVWNDQVRALDAGDPAADWLSEQLGRPARLVHMPEYSTRLVDGLYARAGETVSFADGFPVLLISQASLDDLNSRLPTPVPMNRFRPNLVVEGCPPFGEDRWKRIRIGDIEFEVAKPCSRCAIPSIVQETAGRDPHINRTLASFRRTVGQIYFGQNLLYRDTGQLSVGDPLEVLEEQ